MNETDQKILERPERGPWDGSSRSHAPDFENDLDAFGNCRSPQVQKNRL